MSTYTIKGEPFRYKGVQNVEDCTTSEEVMRKAGLNFKIAKCEVYAKMPGAVDFDNNINNEEQFFHGSNSFKPLTNQFATYRTDINIPLGLVKQQYTPVQNTEAFKFFDDAIGKNQAIWQTAGAFGNGERIFVSAKLPDTILVNDKDPINNYLVFTTSHDGSSGVKILFTPIRVVCQNTLNAAIETTNNFISIRHTQSAGKRLSVAHEILGIAKKQVNTFKEAMEYMVKTKIEDVEAQNVLAKVILTDTELTQITNAGYKVKDIINRQWMAIQDSNISTKKVNVLCEMNNYYFTGIGQQSYIGTAYGVYNAVNGYYSNVDNVEGAKRMDTLLYGDKSRKIKTASDILIKM